MTREALLRWRPGSFGSGFASTDDRFDLAVPATEQRTIATGWLFLGVAALIGAGLFSILLVLARTPYVAKLVPGIDFFHVASVGTRRNSATASASAIGRMASPPPKRISQVIIF